MWKTEPRPRTELELAEAYERLARYLTEAAFEALDEGSRAALLDAEEDPHENAERLRAAMLDVLRRLRPRRGR